MVLSFDTAVGTDFIKNFTSQHANNMDELDAYAGPCLTTHPLRTWTPNLSADNTPPVLGTTGAYIKGLYYRIFDQVYTWGEFQFGSAGASFGNGTYSVTLPFNADSIALNGVNVNFIGEMPPIGNAVMWDASGSFVGQPFTCHLRNNNNVIFGAKINGVTFAVSNSAPVAFAAGDRITWYVRYKALP